MTPNKKGGQRSTARPTTKGRVEWIDGHLYLTTDYWLLTTDSTLSLYYARLELVWQSGVILPTGWGRDVGGCWRVGGVVI